MLFCIFLVTISAVKFCFDSTPAIVPFECSNIKLFGYPGTLPSLQVLDLFLTAPRVGFLSSAGPLCAHRQRRANVQQLPGLCALGGWMQWTDQLRITSVEKEERNIHWTPVSKSPDASHCRTLVF